MPEDITAEFVRDVLDYSPETGAFRWAKRTSNRIHVGDVAGGEDVHGYRFIGLRGKVHKAHRIAWLHFHGEWPRGEIDHVNGNGLDNRICNLRDVASLDNSRNLAIPKHNTSGVLGVSWDRTKGKWYASIGCGGKTIALGRFESKSKAISARMAAEKRLGFHANHGRPQHVS